MGDDELEKELSPVGAIEPRRPRRQRMAFKKVEQATPPERPVDDHRQAALPGQGQEPPFRLPVENIVSKLDEIDVLLGITFSSSS